MLATCQGYLQEAKWCQEKFVPTYEDYVKNGILSSGYLFIFVASYLGMGEIASKDSLMTFLAIRYVLNSYISFLMPCLEERGGIDMKGVILVIFSNKLKIYFYQKTYSY